MLLNIAYNSGYGSVSACLGFSQECTKLQTAGIFSFLLIKKKKKRERNWAESREDSVLQNTLQSNGHDVLGGDRCKRLL